MGRGTVESGLFRSERYGLEVRTTDPAAYNEGEAWIRSDVAPDTDQIATWRFADSGSSTVDVPIFATGTAGFNVAEAVRVRVGGTDGYIPITDAGGTFSYLLAQHAGAQYELHDATAVLDSAIAHFDATELSLNDGDPVTTWADQSDANNDLSANGGPTYVENVQNGLPNVRYDGVDDEHVNTSLQPAPPFAFFIVYAAPSSDSNNSIIRDSGNRGLQTSPSTKWFSIDGDNLTLNISAPYSHLIVTVTVDSAGDMATYRNGTSVATGTGMPQMNDFYVGSAAGGQFGECDIGELVVYDEDISATHRQGVENGLADKWGITL
jgi:hypothetical protein